MIRTQFALYWRTDEYGRRSKTPCKIKPEDAAKLTNPEIIPCSIEYRDLPEPEDGLYGPSHGFAVGPPDKDRGR